MRVQFPAWEDLLEEEGMTTHSSILVWKIPWTEEPGRPTVRGVHRELCVGCRTYSPNAEIS